MRKSDLSMNGSRALGLGSTRNRFEAEELKLDESPMYNSMLGSPLTVKSALRKNLNVQIKEDDNESILSSNSIEGPKQTLLTIGRVETPTKESNKTYNEYKEKIRY